jgi:hypothetical protein
MLFLLIALKIFLIAQIKMKIYLLNKGKTVQAGSMGSTSLKKMMHKGESMFSGSKCPKPSLPLLYCTRKLAHNLFVLKEKASGSHRIFCSDPSIHLNFFLSLFKILICFVDI